MAYWTEIGVVYAICATDRVKVGWTQRPERRFREVVREAGGSGEVLWAHLGTRRLEAELHALFAEWSLGGEWFRAEAGLLTWLGALPSETARRRILCTARPRTRGARDYHGPLGPGSRTKRASDHCEGWGRHRSSA